MAGMSEIERGTPEAAVDVDHHRVRPLPLGNTEIAELAHTFSPSKTRIGFRRR